MQQTICGEFVLFFLGTLYISYIFYGSDNKINIYSAYCYAGYAREKDMVLNNRTSNIALFKPLSLHLARTATPATPDTKYYSSHNYSTRSASKVIINNNALLDPSYISGYIDAESCFQISIRKNLLHGVKTLEFVDFCEAALLARSENNKEHLSSGLTKLIGIKARMNSNKGNEDSFIVSSGFTPTRPLYNKALPLISRYTVKVKILLNRDNPQVTKAFNSLVGTSEAIRLLNRNIRYIHNKSGNSDTNKKFRQWLAGLIDGDGCFTYSKKGYAGLEITMDIRDERAIMYIKNIYGGSVKLRSNANALRYRLHHKEGLLRLINDVNGLIRNSHRLVQLNKVCIKYDINLILPEKLTYDNAWFAGFFDADGSISINKSNWQLSITATQKTSELLNPLIDLYGGNIYVDNGSSQSFKWYISKREDVLKLLKYFKENPPKSAKNKRLHLVNKFYELKDMEAHKAVSETLLAKSWLIFYKKWSDYE